MGSTTTESDIQPIPVGNPISQTNLPTVGDATLVDDTVALVDSATALSGGQASIHPDMKIGTKPIVPRSTLRIRR